MRRRANGSSRVRPVAVGRRANALGVALVDALSRAADGALVTDPEGRIILWNGAAKAMLGYAPNELLGRPCRDLFGSEDVNGNTLRNPDRANDRLKRRGAIPTFDIRMLTKSDVTVWLNVSTLSLRDRHHREPFLVYLFRDVTSSKQVLALARDAAPSSPNQPSSPLTRREREVLGLMGEGLNTAGIAGRLHLSRATVRNHVQNILLKLKVHSRLEAVAHALRHRPV